MSDPDWGRFGIVAPKPITQAAATQSPLGDPVRWGANVLQTIEFGSLAPNRGAINQSGQIVQAQCRDAYPRAWTIVGTLSAPANIVTLPDGAAVDQWAAVMSVSMGIGQSQIVHNFNIRQIIASDAQWYWNSNIGDEIFGTSGNVIRPFVIPGAIVGGTVAISIIQSLFSSTVGDFIANIQTTLAITPFDPGVHP